MGNCIGRQARRPNQRYRYSAVAYNERDVPLSARQINIRQPQRSELIRVDDQRTVQSNSTVEDSPESSLEQSISTMGYLFSKEKDQEVPKSGSLDTSPSPSLSNSSFSSYSSHSTSFLSDDQLILSSSSSSSYSNQIYLSSNYEPFSISLPHCNKDFLHQNIISHHCPILSSVIDDLLQQQSIRIHRQTTTILLEYEPFLCIQLNDFNQSDRPSFIFDDNQKRIYITKYAHWPGLPSISYNSQDLPPPFSPCDDCSLLLSGMKLTQYVRSFITANATYNLMQMCFEKSDTRNLFGYISSIDFNGIRQTIINDSKLNSSSDLQVNYSDIYFVLRVQSWPKEIRSSYEQRTRLWPINPTHLFDSTCFIQYQGNQYPTCEKFLSSDSSWSYTYAAIEGQLVRLMSNGQIRFASIVWNYLNSKTHGQLSFLIFKHTLFYFFERYSSDVFTTSDLFRQLSSFLQFLVDRLQTKSIPHYFNIKFNLFNENISIDWISIQTTTCLDLRHSSIHSLPNSSTYLYHLIYLIQFQSKFRRDFPSIKNDIIQTILETHEYVMQQFSTSENISKQQLNFSKAAIKSFSLFTADSLYRYQEENVQIIVDYLPLLRFKESSLVLHLFWSIFIQYFNFLFDDLFIS